MNSWISNSNADYIEQLYLDFKQDASSLDKEWQRFFQGVEFSTPLGLSKKELDVYHLIVAYRHYGHFEANLDPLNLTPRRSDLLSLSRFQLTEADLDKKFEIGRLVGLPGAPLKTLIDQLKKSYCGTLTVQVAEAVPEIQDWFIREMEGKAQPLAPAEKKEILQSITKTEALEKFLHTRFVGAKRFSIEGCDALLPMLETLVKKSTDQNVQEIIIGMAHRGRVNVLANFMGKSLEFIFAEFDGSTQLHKDFDDFDDFDGDVKYHLGARCVKATPFGKCQITLAFNPSHLEAVNPVVLGMTRAAQRFNNDIETRKKVIPVLIHGDAAFSGQGVVAETFQMSQVQGYTVGGTIHIVTDNQIGFTTQPVNSRSSEYSTDIAKLLATPVIHANGDDADACVRAIDMALRFRQEFGQDIVINVHGYRRFGHNEGDEPSYTQPIMYNVIRSHPTLREIYGKQLIKEGIVNSTFYEDDFKQNIQSLQNILDSTRKNPPILAPVQFEGFWQGLRKGKTTDFLRTWRTSLDIEVLEKIANLLGHVPEGFHIHPKLTKLLETRLKVAEDPKAKIIDWGLAELLAYGSLIWEGTSVRLSGQDCVRGTFTHRHSAFYDTKTNEPYFALKNLRPDKMFCVYDSVLSEYAVLGFEYGNAISDPTFLTLWEAQFGDFANGAQIIIDQFISSGETKWQQMCGLILLLPHGYEGQGPEHSSARLERFMNLCAQHNIQVCNVTTPAQIFHLIRRQIKRPFRKPLIVMSPKSLLRHPQAVSSLEELAQEHFHEVLDDTTHTQPEQIEKIVLCSGKLYYDLLEGQKDISQEPARVSIVRLEQLYPFPDHKLGQIIKRYPNAKTLVWAQEEPRNMGAWQNISFKLTALLQEQKSPLQLSCVSRPERASPATGSAYTHKKEQKHLVQKALEVKPLDTQSLETQPIIRQ